METKAKINKWGLINLKSFYIAKETINKIKRQSTDCEKKFANDTSNHGLIDKTYSLYSSLSKKQTVQAKMGRK